MKEAQILQSYEIAKERYAAIGVDTEKAVETLEKTPISLHCWQTDDVIGFESAAGLSGGIQTTGNYPGRARNIDEVRADVKFAYGSAYDGRLFIQGDLHIEVRWHAQSG